MTCGESTARRATVACHEATDPLGRRIVFAATGLSNTAHTLQLTVLGTKNPASSGFRVDVDAFAVLR